MSSNSYGRSWEDFRVDVLRRVHSLRKRQNMLKERYGHEEEHAFKERNLNDTKYITTLVMNLIREHLFFEDYCDTSKKQHVFSVNGVVTAYMRKRYGLIKNRETDRHHAQDAVVIACATPNMIHEISRYVKGRELRYTNNQNIVNEETGELFNPKDYSRDEWDNMFGKDFPEPWRFFREEVEMRMSEWPEKYLKELYKRGYEVNPEYIRVHANDDEILKGMHLWTETISPFFISKKPNHIITGRAHEETISSPKIYEEGGNVIRKVALSKLKLAEGDIVSGNGKYYNPQDDRLLYEALVKRLKEYDGDGDKAFSEPFYKPRHDGSDGPEVRKVKMLYTQSVAVYTNDKRGIAGSGNMVRIDIFLENGKYYMVPVYIYQAVEEELPIKAVKAHQNSKDWKEMKEDNYIFSLSSGDVVYIKEKSGNEIIGYYRGVDISGATIKIETNDGSKEFRKGIQNLSAIEKYEVDILGRLRRITNVKGRQVLFVNREREHSNGI